MIQKEDITHLATLARVHIDETELASMTTDIERILEYVGQVNTVDTSVVPEFIHTNIMRDDVVTHASGAYTQAVLDNAPQTERGFVKVKKILS
jgi:aspartyl-tRNA(Asn)/glutamyl-tRNA(Gln) amidotransferase subunit C